MASSPASPRRTTPLRFRTKSLLLILPLLALLVPAPASAQSFFGEGSSNNLASQDLFPSPGAAAKGAGGGGYLAEITEKEKQAALDRFLFGQPHGHAKVPNGSPEPQKAAAAAAAGGSNSGRSGSSGADNNAVKSTSQTRQRRSSSRSARRRRRLEDDDRYDDYDDDEEDDRCVQPQVEVERSPIGKFFHSLSWVSSLLWAYTYMASLRTYLVLRFFFLPPLRLFYTAGHYTFTTLYSGMRSATLHSLRPVRLLIVAPIAYLLLGVYHVFLEVPLGVAQVVGKELYPLYLFLGAATTIGMSLGFGAGIVLLAGSFVFKEGSSFEQAVGAEAEKEGRKWSKKAGLEKTDKVRERGNASTKRGSGGKASSAAEGQPRRKSVIGKAMKEIKRNSRSRYEEEYDNEEVYDVGDDAGAFGMWSGEKDKHSSARRHQEKGKGRRQEIGDIDEEDGGLKDRLEADEEDESE